MRHGIPILIKPEIIGQIASLIPPFPSILGGAAQILKGIDIGSENILPGRSPVIRAGGIGAILLPPIDEVGSGSGPAQVGISIPRFVEIAPSGFLRYTVGPDRAGKSRRRREQNADTKSIEGMISHVLFRTFFYSKNKFLMGRTQKTFSSLGNSIFVSSFPARLNSIRMKILFIFFFP